MCFPRHAFFRSLFVFLLISLSWSTHGLRARDDAMENEDKAIAGVSPHSLTFSYALGVNGAGSILNDAILGLDVLELLVNTDVIYIPEFSPLIRAGLPVYQIPDFELWNNNGALDYQYRGSGSWSFGVSLGYLEIEGKTDIPNSFVDWGRFGINIPGYFQVTREIRGKWFNLATAYQLDGTLAYYFAEGETLHPYIKGTLGIGHGWLGAQRSAYLDEVHLGLGAGLKIVPDQSYFLITELSITGYIVKTRPTFPFNFTKVLVNPGVGNIYLVRLRFGMGFPL